MIRKFGIEIKVGLFALATVIILGYATLKVGGRSVVSGGGYDMYVYLDSASGINKKTPVLVAGMQVGVVKDVELVDYSTRAKLTLRIKKDVVLREGTQAVIRSKGFLGQTFVELIPAPLENQEMPKKAEIPFKGVTGDMNELISQFNDIARDIKAVTSSLKEMIGKDESSPVYRVVKNLDTFTEELKNLTLRNEAKFNQISGNLVEITENLRNILARGRQDITRSMDSIASITQKIDEGRGTIGKLVNEEETVNKLNEALENLSNTLGGLRKLETEIGYHVEYLGKREELKNYVHLNLKPRPDEAFMFEFVTDPNPPADRKTVTTDITANNHTSTVTTHTAEQRHNDFLVSAQLAKKFYDFTLRGGVIESTGGVGLDYNKGPFGLAFSAYDFSKKYGQGRAHLKLMGNLNLTKNIYLVGGADDMINPTRPTDWFIGAGFRLVDEDIKSLFGLGSAATAIRR